MVARESGFGHPKMTVAGMLRPGSFHRSISPKTISMDPSTADTSASM